MLAELGVWSVVHHSGAQVLARNMVLLRLHLVGQKSSRPWVAHPIDRGGAEVGVSAQNVALHARLSSVVKKCPSKH